MGRAEGTAEGVWEKKDVVIDEGARPPRSSHLNVLQVWHRRRAGWTKYSRGLKVRLSM